MLVNEHLLVQYCFIDFLNMCMGVCKHVKLVSEGNMMNDHQGKQWKEEKSVRKYFNNMKGASVVKNSDGECSECYILP